MSASRREFLKNVGLGSASLSVGSAILPSWADVAFANNVSTTPLLGVIATNDPMSYLRFSQWFGHKPRLATLNFNQTSPKAFISSIPYIVNVGKAYIQLGAQVAWSVPCPGKRQLEAIVAGTYDSDYTNLFKSILAVSPADNSPILVRLPWEFNLLGQENQAKDKNDKWASALFIYAWRKIATIARQTSPRFQRIWCPNACSTHIEPTCCCLVSCFFCVSVDTLYAFRRSFFVCRVR